ncbi:MAG TPA: hypothetical protein DD435_02770 [Cyanobacteria bacterium UBA8530]|nr:hypothetical protein [Cyanobacteria bacterium UBA8530]
MKIDLDGTRLFEARPLASLGEASAFLRSWGEAENDFPRHFKRSLALMGWKDLALVIAFPGYEIARLAIKLDLFALARSGSELVALVVMAAPPQPHPAEQQFRELFGAPIESPYLLPAAAALLEADRFGASQAFLVAHSFGEKDRRAFFASFASFARFIGIEEPDLAQPRSLGPLHLRLGWIEAGPDYPE